MFAPNGISPTDKRGVPEAPAVRANELVHSSRLLQAIEPHQAEQGKSDKTARFLLLFSSFSLSKREKDIKTDYRGRLSLPTKNIIRQERITQIMNFTSKNITLKNGSPAILRAPRASDAAEMVEYLKTTAAETEFLIRYPEECRFNEEMEKTFLENTVNSKNDLMIVCEVEGKIAGNCQISFNNRIKTSHRATVGIALLREFWELGIGTKLFEELIAAAKTRGVSQIELEVIEGNERAIHLYEKMGFTIVAEKPNAIRLKDGTLLREFFMVKYL